MTIIQLKNTRIILFLLLHLCIYNTGQAQKQYSIVSIDSIAIGSYTMSDNIADFKTCFGNPKQYKEYTDPNPPEGMGKTYYLMYDSLTATFCEYYRKIILASVDILNQKYIVKTLKYGNFRINDSIDKLKTFNESYTEFIERQKTAKLETEKMFHIQLKSKNGYGIITMWITNNKISKIGLSTLEND